MKTLSLSYENFIKVLSTTKASVIMKQSEQSERSERLLSFIFTSCFIETIGTIVSFVVLVNSNQTLLFPPGSFSPCFDHPRSNLLR